MKKIIALILVLVLSLSLAACGGSSGTGSAPAVNSGVKQNVTGRYEIQSIQWDDGTSSSGDTLALMGPTYVELFSDNSATFCLFGVTMDMEFSDTHMWRAGTSFFDYTLSVKDGRLTLTDNNTTYIFVKK